MARLRHPNCCQYLGLCLDPPSLLMEYCSQRSVDTILSAGRTDSKAHARAGGWRGVALCSLERSQAGRRFLHTCSPLPSSTHQVAKSLSWPRLLSMAFDAAKVSGGRMGGREWVWREVVTEALRRAPVHWQRSLGGVPGADG